MPPKKAAAAKGSKAETQTFAIGDVCLGRIKGYPPWPAKIVNPDTEYLSKGVQSAKPKKGDVLLVRFYPDASYTWSTNNELKPLPREEIEAYLSKHDGKGHLVTAYKVAQDPEKWEARIRDEQETKRQKDKDRAEGKAVDTEEEEEDEEAQTGSKRKRGGGKGKATSKKAKTDNKKKDAKGKKETLSEGEQKNKDWRHKLQKTFLTPNTEIKDDDYKACDKAFEEMDVFEHRGEWLASTKLPKVLRRIVQLDHVPKDDEYKFKERAKKLLDGWSSIIGVEEDKPAETSTAATDGEAAPTEEPTEPETSKTDEINSESKAPEAEAEKPTDETMTEANGDATAPAEETPAQEEKDGNKTIDDDVAAAKEDTGMAS